MKKIYTFLPLQSVVLLMLALLFTSSSVWGQCGSVVENFENTSGSTGGFTGSFSLASDGSNTYLQKDKILEFAEYNVTTPTYQLAANQNDVGYGFTLGGSVPVSNVTVKVQYSSDVTQEVITVPLDTDVVPTYDAQTGTAQVCGTVSFTNLPGFPTSGRYRLVFEFDPASGTGLATQTITFDDYRTNGTISQIPLPVTFFDFEAKTINNNVQLTWKVAGEEDVIRYDIERSTDGRHFVTIGNVTKTGQNVYTYTDASSTGIVYYRIKNVDLNGAFKYSSILHIVNGNTVILLKAFPQPALSHLTIQHPSISRRALLSISTADGRIVRSVIPAIGSMQSSVDMGGLQSGMYLLRFDAGDGKVQTLKVLKQ